MYGFFPFQFPNTLSENVSSRGGKREAAKADGLSSRFDAINMMPFLLNGITPRLWR
jgi:hypothetical protein